MPKNVTPNCSMLDLILVYFKSICQIFEGLEEAISTECASQNLKHDAEIVSLIHSKVSEVDPVNPMVKIFSLKDFKECETEPNI